MNLSEVSDSTDDAPDEPESIATFVCYRREDSAHAAGRIYDRLVQRFGESHVFMDVDAIPLGVDFGESIDEAVSRCEAFLAVIGKQWLAKDEHGNRRIDDQRDFVRLEIATALRRRIRVIPVLVEGASMPSREELPVEIRTLVMRNGLELRHQRFNADVTRLLDELERIPHESRTPPPVESRPPGELASDPDKMTPAPARVMRLGETPKPPFARPIGAGATPAPARVAPTSARETPAPGDAPPPAVATPPVFAQPIGETPAPLRVTPIVERETPYPAAAMPTACVESLAPTVATPPPARAMPAPTEATPLPAVATPPPAMAAPAEGSIAPVTASAPPVMAVPPVAPHPETAPPEVPKANEPTPTAIVPAEPAPQPIAPVELPVAKQSAPKSALPPLTTPKSAPTSVATHREQSPAESELPEAKLSRIPARTKKWPAIAGGLLVGGVAITLLWAGGKKSESAVPPVTANATPSAAFNDGRSGQPTTGESSAAPALASVEGVATPPITPNIDRPETDAMVRIPAGSFLMGSNDGDKDEQPAHEVDVPSFDMDLTEVTVKSYQACVNAGKCEKRTTVFGDWYRKHGGLKGWSEACNFGQAERDNHPMNCVDWSDAERFCKWAD